MKTYTVPVRYTGKIECQIDANSEQEALSVAEEMAANEENLDEMEDIDYEVLPAVAVSKSKSDGQDADAAGDKTQTRRGSPICYVSFLILSRRLSTLQL